MMEDGFANDLTVLGVTRKIGVVAIGLQTINEMISTKVAAVLMAVFLML